MYRAELYAILVALEVFRGDLEIVSDCKGVVDEAERIRNGGRVNPSSRHADLWTRYVQRGAEGPRYPERSGPLGPLPRGGGL